MKKIHLLFISSILSVASLSYGKDFEHKMRLNADSRTHLLQKKHISTLEALQGKGNSVVLAGLLDAVRLAHPLSVSDNSHTMEKNNRFAVVRGNEWNLMVYGDGTKASYMNEALFKLVKSESHKTIELNRLEEIGRQFIDNYLSEYIVIGSNEELVAFHSIDEIDSVHTDEADVLTEEQVASIVVFSRRINGVDVIGMGSKVSVMFANDETPVGFNFDWPAYRETLNMQQVVSKSSAINRLSALGTTQGNIESLTLDRFECGYFDPGYATRALVESKTIQIACSAFYHGKRVVADGTNTDYSYVNFVPVAELSDLEYDADWLENVRLYEDGEQCRTSDATPVWLNELNQ